MSLSSTRREFLSLLGAAGAVSLGSQLVPRWVHAAGIAPAGVEGRVLVLIQLAGGNDGLNTVIPFAHDEYHQARPGIGFKQQAVIALNDEFGLHPSLRGLKEIYDSGRLAIVQGVGYPQPDRSHFRSMDIWHTADPTVDTPRDGWLGRALEWRFDHQPSLSEALALGMDRLPLLMASRRVTVPVIRKLEEYHLQSGNFSAEFQAAGRAARERQLSVTRSEPGTEIEFLRSSLKTAITSAERLKSLAAEYAPARPYPASYLAQQLKLVAQMIAADLPPRVYLISLDGFDTHSQQQPGHAALLSDLGEAISAFSADLAAHQAQDRVLLATFSEFGRRVKENGSLGTDHGAASMLFAVSPTGKGGFHGQFPSLNTLDDGDLIHTTDFRRVFATFLDRWLEIPSAPLLGGSYELLPFV